MTPREERIDDLIHGILRRPATPAVLAMYAQLIETGRIDWATLERLIRSSSEAADRRNDPGNRDAVTDVVKAATGSTVLDGPFAGMRLIDRSSRGDGDLAPKLLGTYEQELQPCISACLDRRYDAIVDIGSAEGYYAVGLALLLPAMPVFAFDPDAVAQTILRRNARLNGCEDRITLAGACDPAALATAYRSHPNALVVCDCEGYEAALFGDPATNALGTAADLLIECHDQWDATITPRLVAALSPTHEIATIAQSGRDPHRFAFLSALSEWDRWRAVWERRGAAQHWLFCQARTPG